MVNAKIIIPGHIVNYFIKKNRLKKMLLFCLLRLWKFAYGDFYQVEITS